MSVFFNLFFNQFFAKYKGGERRSKYERQWGEGQVDLCPLDFDPQTTLKNPFKKFSFIRFKNKFYKQL